MTTATTLTRTRNLPAPHHAWSGSKKLIGDRIARIDGVDDWTIEVYRASTGRLSLRLYFWHHTQDASREGYLADVRIRAHTLDELLARGR